MQYIIFGAGQTGKKALWMLGDRRVECFADNKCKVEKMEGKQIISYSKMKKKANERRKYIVVIASEKYYMEMERQLCEDSISNYFIFHESDAQRLPLVYPQFFIYRNEERISYTRILALNHIEKYKKIAIFGTNQFLHYLISEIAFQVGIDYIVAIVDNTGTYKESTMGIPICRYEDVESKIDCLVINEKWEEEPFLDKILYHHHSYRCIEIYNVDFIVPEYVYPKLEKYKDIHKGKRCFLIGNGSSLTVKDLDILHEHCEICFGFNRIFKIYDKTLWRPDYLGISDGSVMPANIQKIEEESAVTFIGDEWHRWIDVCFKNVEPFHLIVQFYKKDGNPRFSENIAKGTYFGYSVVYDIGLQFAVYMGFTEIYLLGVDHSFMPRFTDDYNHFIKDYFTAEEKEFYYRITNGRACPEKDRITRAFEMAERYTKEHGIHIYNATRGGELEVFERVNFDTLFESS